MKVYSHFHENRATADLTIPLGPAYTLRKTLPILNGFPTRLLADSTACGGLERRRADMDMKKTKQALEQAFRRDIGDGTLMVELERSTVKVDGGNWRLIALANGALRLELPTNDANYYDDDTDAFIENVIGTEVEESLAVADQELDGALVAGLREADDAWSTKLGKRIEARGYRTITAP